MTSIEYMNGLTLYTNINNRKVIWRRRLQT